MARARSSGNGQLEEATRALQQSQAILTQSMAQLVQNQAAFEARVSEMARTHAEDMRRIDARFAQVEAILAEHGRILLHLSELMQGLPDAVRGKFGFRPPE